MGRRSDYSRKMGKGGNVSTGVGSLLTGRNQAIIKTGPGGLGAPPVVADKTFLKLLSESENGIKIC